MVRACGRKVADIRHLRGQLVERLQLQRHASFIGNCQQMQHRVGRAADSHFAAKRVAERRRSEDITRLDVLFDQLHNLHARMLGQMDARGRYRRRGAVAGQRHTDGFRQAVHGVCRVHACARAAARAGIALSLVESRIVHDAGLVCADRLKGFGERDLLAAKVTGQHRPAGDDDRRDVQARCCHQHAGHNLVTVRDEHERVKLVRLRERLDAVRNQLAAGQRVLHADVPHRNTVAHADCRHEDGRAARRAHTRLDGIGNLVQIDMAGDNLTVCGNHADDWALHLLVGQAAGTQQ